MKSKHIRLFIVVAALLIAVLSGQLQLDQGSAPTAGAGLDSATERSTRAVADDAAAIIASAYEAGRSDVDVTGSGRVERVLADDNKGSRHQRFILELADGHTILIAHNIDLAPRLPGLREGDVVEFSGVYEWNDRGGVVHWTHHDPQGRRDGGWLRYRGKRYE